MRTSLRLDWESEPAMEVQYQEALKLVKKQVRAVEYRNWIKPVQAMHWDNGTITLLVKDGEFQKWFVEHYEGVLTRALEEVARKPVQVEYKVKQPELFDVQSARASARQPEFVSDYAFDNFVVGPCNHMAYAAARAVSNRPGRAYNPLFIYGGSGLGKTHLLYAIGATAQKLNPRLRIVYITLDAFLHDFYSAIRMKRMDQFRVKYRDSCDVLLVDDIQFLSGKGESTQTEFFHIFNALHSARKQIIFTSDRFPRDIPDIEERLLSRFEWGLIADVKPPQVETRLAILKRKAEEASVQLPEEVAQFIASEVSDNIRELESCLNRLHLEAQTRNVDVTLKLAKDSLKAYFRQRARRITPEAVRKAVAHRYHVGIEELMSKSRKKTVATPRHVAMYLTRKLTHLSYPEIGACYGGRDHSSVISGIRKIERSLMADNVMLQSIQDIEYGLKRA